MKHTLSVALVGLAALVLSGCATAGGSAPDAEPGQGLGSLWPGPPSGEVTGQGTVMDVDGDVELCLGAIAESYPPQCSGIPVEGWNWDGLEGSETSGSTQWGAYAVQGTYNGETFTLTQTPVMLALYDPMPFPDPTDGVAGTTDEKTLLAIQEELPDRLGDEYFSSYPENGYLWVDVLWDDGTWQAAADTDFGDDVVIIRSALRTVG